MIRYLLGVALLVIAAAIPADAHFPSESQRYEPLDLSMPAASSPFRLLSYNVKGTPWPLLSDRTPDLAAIAVGLRAERSHAEQPRVVVLQEAFLPEAKAIGREAGYRYIAFGPSADATSMVQPTSRDRLFAAQASFWSGETMGKYVDSGLALFSDYPILWVKRVAFPNFACAGWDCLASKGALAAALQVPGIAKPLVIVTTHLNARSAAGVPHSRSNYAFERQVDLLNRFLSTLEMQGEPMLLAGDFNVGSDPFRETSFSRLVADRGLWVVAAEHRCGDGCDRAIAPRLDHGLGLATGKSMVLYRRSASLWPSAMSVFGRARGGTMLSDHIGLMVQFRANARAPQHGPNVSGSV